ncbi:uncharacterized protein [Porites lutea]|uniref:uncharacterized protein n=1 Tax=Porites lutea TaxID=51062 RepID=UPI003CC5F5BF
MTKMSEFSQISRLQEENQKALRERKQRLLTCEKFKQDYEKLEELLKTLPQKTSHEVMVPIGSMAFMPGKLVHTNEITVLLGDNWFAERSASQAVEIVARRKKYLETNIAGLNADIESFDARIKFASDIQSTAEGNSDVKEIKEELSIQDEERLLNRGTRKAHPKAKQFGGSKRVEGLKSSIKDHNSTQKDIKKKAIVTDDLALFARLDELEKTETANAELDQFLDEEKTEIKTDSEYRKKEDDVRWVPSLMTLSDDNNKKKVTWGDDDDKKDADGNVGDSDDDSDDDDEDGRRTIAVKFSHSSTLSHGQVLDDKSLDQNLKERSVVTPADLYSQFTPKQELKSILRKPSSEGKKKQASKDQVALTAEVQAGTIKEKTEKDFDLQKAFTGTIVEKPSVQSEQHDSSASQMSKAQPGKKTSRFKAARQKQQ